MLRRKICVAAVHWSALSQHIYFSIVGHYSQKGTRTQDPSKSGPKQI